MTKTEREIAMFGMTSEDIEIQYMQSLTAKCSGLEMVVAGILSDCQELMAFEQPDFNTIERIRKQLNVAKFVLFEMSDAKETR